jgi:hypothetical protein
MLTDDGRLFWNSIANAPTEAIASAIAFHDVVSVTGAARAMMEDFFNGRDDTLIRKVNEAAALLGKKPREELILELLGCFARVCDLRERGLHCRRDLEDVCEELVAAAVRFRRQQRESFEGTSLGDLIEDVVQGLFERIEKDAAAEGPKSDAVLERVEEFISRLPEDQREDFRRSLGVDRITRDALRAAATKGGLAAALAAAVKIGGFGFYMGAVSALAWIAAAFGITLPFSVYVALTSGIAVLTNPIFLAAVLSGGGWWMIVKSNETIHRGLLPFVVFQLSAAGAMAEGDTAATTRDVLAAWKAAADSLADLHVELGRAREVTAGIEAEQSRLRVDRRKVVDRKNERASARRELIAKLRELGPKQIASIVDGEWGPRAKAHGERLRELERHQQETRERPTRAGLVPGLLDSLGKARDQFSSSLRFQKACEEVVDRVIEDWDSGVREIRTDVRQVLEELTGLRDDEAELGREVASLDVELERVAERWRESREKERNLEANIKAGEKRYWGLGVRDEE